jgi:hypothetical protein
MSFRDNASRTPLAASVRPAGQPSTNRCRLAAIAEREGCQAKFSEQTGSRKLLVFA